MVYYIRYGADIAFDNRTLTEYSADRTCTIRIFLIAKSNVANAFASLKSAFAAPKMAFAPIAA